MREIFRGIFIGLALFAASGLRVWCVTPEFIDSLRVELSCRNMPERIVFLPLALADQRMDGDREGIWSLTALDAIRGMSFCRTADQEPTDVPTVISDSTDVRFNDRLSTRIALDRLQELFNDYGDWDMSIVAFATSPTALSTMDTSSMAGAGILKSLRWAEEEYSENLPEAFGRIESLVSQRKAERLAFLQEKASLQQARLDSLRKKQVEVTDRISYTIKRGDTLGGIAARYHVRVSDLKKWNNLKSDMIRDGRKLVIYKH